MVCKRVHHNGKREDMAAHHENQDDQLGTAEELPAETAHEDFARVCHIVHMGILQSKLAEHIASVRGDQAEAYNKNHGAKVEGSAFHDLLSLKRNRHLLLTARDRQLQPLTGETRCLNRLSLPP